MEYKVTKLNRGEKPCREELYELFITQNLPIRVLCELYNRTEPIITKWLRSYNINKEGRLHKIYNAGTECYVKILDNFL